VEAKWIAFLSDGLCYYGAVAGEERSNLLCEPVEAKYYVTISIVFPSVKHVK